MDASAVTKVSVALAVIGLSALWITGLFIKPEDVAISDIVKTGSEDVVIRGYVTGLRDYGNFIVAEVSEVKSVDVVIFDKRMVKSIGSNVSIEGQLRDYHGKKELVAESVRVVN
ncbi:hypothetical protein HYU12_04525 [Candidatus Woesearchaeota archaeon]|nr:hypothetical protein [Candidatus Woesearchaeota archaeon]